MKKLLIYLFVLLLTACTDETKKANLPPQELYKTAKYEIANGSTELGISLLKELQILHPNSKYTVQSKLDVAYALMLQEEYDDAITQLNRFLKLYPNNLGTDYAYYLKGFISETRSKSILDSHLTDQAQRDIKTVREAFEYYVELIKKFPKSKYSDEAKTKLFILRNVLARHELYVARFYAKRKAYIASINRAKTIIEEYAQTPSVAAALTLLIRNYTIIGATKLAKDAKRVLDKNFPNYKPHF
jgi:outer membrane protein assembly factor BamD